MRLYGKLLLLGIAAILLEGCILDTDDISNRASNKAPVAVNDGPVIVVIMESIFVDVLANDTDDNDGIDASTLVVTEDSTLGSATLQDGMILYTAGAISGGDTFKYAVKDTMGAISNEAMVSITIDLDTDGDGDGDGAGNATDSDGDGISDADEITNGTAPFNPDTDGDGADDGVEGTTDTDGDGIIDALESSSTDTDGDGIPDQQDIDNTNPPAKPTLITPIDGAVLSGSSQLYEWHAGQTGVLEWSLYVGSSAGGDQWYDSGSPGLAASVTVTGLPTDGSTVYNRLRYRTVSGWSFVDSSNRAVTVYPMQELTTIHRSGQTFLTWSEVHNQAAYHVYRHTQAITSANLSAATRLTAKWGPLGTDTSRHRYPTSAAPVNLVIEDSGNPLSDTTALFVHTTQSGEAGNAYYAVTTFENGVEANTLLATSQAVTESVATPKPILAVSVNQGKGRVYTQFMDYANWNPTLAGYAFNFSVALPADYNPDTSYPLQINLHAYTERYLLKQQAEHDWDVIQLFPDDPGFGTTDGVHTWWYGFAAEHDFGSGSAPSSGTIVNFTEQRVLQAVDEVISNSDFNVDTDLVYASGHSMGASGALSLGMRYGNLISGIYASQPMTDYRNSPAFQNELRSIWGSPSDNLPIENRGSYALSLLQYGQGGASPTGVWDWMDHNTQLRRRRGEEMAFLIVDHGKADLTIEWASQGNPVYSALTDANAGFAGVSKASATHGWMAFSGAYPLRYMFGLGYGIDFPWRYPLSQSFVGVQNASGSGNTDPAADDINVDDLYNQTIEWSTSANDFDLSFNTFITETASSYDISLRSTNGADQTADITPRRTQAFSPAVGQLCSWKAYSLSNNTTIAGQGNLAVDADGLATALSVPILSGSGSRLVIDCS